MSANESCYLCGTELRGALELKCFAIGNIIILFLKGTEDCNWLQCKFCGKPLCKRCYMIERSICSDTCFFSRLKRRHSAVNGVPFAERGRYSDGQDTIGNVGSIPKPNNTDDRNKPAVGGQ